MPLPPLQVTLSEGQKIDALKRFRAKYTAELEKIDLELTDILTNLAEADFVGAYLGDQPEVAEMRTHKADVEKLERRRQHIGAIIERLDQVIPKQADIHVPVPGTAGRSGGGNIKKY